MLTKKKKLRIAKLLAVNWYIGVHSTDSVEAISQISQNTAELAMEIGGIELSNLVYELYDQIPLSYSIDKLRAELNIEKENDT